MRRRTFVQHFGCKEETFVQNILGAKIDFCSNILDVKEDCCSTFWVRSKTYFLMRKKTSVHHFGCKARLLCSNIFDAMEAFVQHFGCEARLLFLNILGVKLNFCSNIVDAK